MNRYLQAALETAQRAGMLLLGEFQKARRFEYKTGAELVTNADRRSEALIVDQLRTFFPHHSIVAEEGSGQEKESEYCWYVDPIDGTTNFAHGLPAFAVSLGLVHQRQTVVAVVCDPIREEVFHAVRGEGAWLNQRRIQVSEAETLAESLLATGFPAHNPYHALNMRYYERCTNLSHGVRRIGSAALDLCYIACGRFDGYWEFGLKSWDTAAGVLLVAEAGGVVSDMKGLPYELGGPHIAASNGRIHAELQRVFAEVAQEAQPPHVL